MDISGILGKRKAPKGIRSELTCPEVRELGNREIRKVIINH
ncbi:MAG: hypothetical protein ACUVWO_09235 [Thermodesulfobacteriota bacterium]